MSYPDLIAHVLGRSRFIDDGPDPTGLLHAAAVTSPAPHARLGAIDASKTRAMPGVRAVLTAADIPGTNQIGGIIQDEELFATDAVHFIGQPLAVVVADTPQRARAAARACVLDLEALPAIFDPREAAAKGELITASRTLEAGDVDAAWEDCDVVVEGRADTAGQEHLYLETQAALALPEEGGRIKLWSSTQAPKACRASGVSLRGDARRSAVVARIRSCISGHSSQASQNLQHAWLAASSVASAIRNKARSTCA